MGRTLYPEWEAWVKAHPPDTRRLQELVARLRVDTDGWRRRCLETEIIDEMIQVGVPEFEGIRIEPVIQVKRVADKAQCEAWMQENGLQTHEDVRRFLRQLRRRGAPLPEHLFEVGDRTVAVIPGPLRG